MAKSRERDTFRNDRKRDKNREERRAEERRLREPPRPPAEPFGHFMRLIQDEDCHWYVIRFDEEDAFRAWQAAGPYWENYEGKDFNECRVDGPHMVLFSSYVGRPAMDT